MRSEIKNIIVRLIDEKYSNAAAVFWAGSVPTGNFTNYSDLDIVIVFDQIPNAYRETFLYEGWKVDAFIHDLGTLHYFFEEIDRKSGKPALPTMIVDGILMTPSSPLSEKIKQLASKAIKKGPPKWTQSDIDKARFFITDLLDDIRGTSKRSDQIASSAKLYDLLGEFYFRAQNKWQASGKILLRYLKKQNYDLAERYRDAFDDIFKYGHTAELESLVKEILKPYGGLLWEGYRMDAPETWRLE
jgi:predicted nucleotidyltransferase